MKTLNIMMAGAMALSVAACEDLTPRDQAIVGAAAGATAGLLTANLLNVIAESDHITPPCQSEGIMEMVGSEDKEVFRVRGGHIGIMAGRGAEKNTWPHIESWLAARSE